jgi:TRAP-type C4-dicarboxylate transport system permease small subunit
LAHEDDETRGERALSAFERLLMAVSMGLLCLITMANVLVRYFTDISFAFTEEVSIFLMVVMTLVGASHAFAKNHHIAITYFVDRKPRIQHAARRLATVCSLAMFGLLAVLGSKMAWDDWKFEVTTPSLGVPQWWYTIWLPAIAALIVVRLLLRLKQDR